MKKSRRNLGNDELQELLDVARLYYNEHLSQREIAKRMKVLPMYVGRLLQKAHDRGIIKIQILAPVVEDARRELMRRFSFLKDALVVPSSEDFVFERRLCAQAAAEYFEMKVDDGVKSVALSGGYTVYEMVNALPKRHRRLDIYPTAIIGRGPGFGPSPDNSVNVDLLWSKSGEKIATSHYASILPPENLNDIKELQKDQNEFLKRPTIRKVYNGMRRVECVFTSIGNLVESNEYRRFSLAIRKFARSGMVKQLTAEGVAGGVSYSFFDSEGNSRASWNFAISLDVDHLKKMVNEGKSVVIIAGRYKEKSLAAALKGKIGNVLITDDRTARQLLESS